MGGWNFIDRTGMEFEYFNVISYLGNRKWKCICKNCGNECVVDSAELPVNGNSNRRLIKSCGCMLKSRLIGNIDYFKEINTEGKAYFLGLFSADATITDDIEKGTYSIKLVLQKQDRDIIEKLKKEVGTEAQIKDFVSTNNLPQGGNCTSDFSSLLLCSKDMVRDLQKYGVTPRKSLSLKINYDLIPKSLWRHFIRGAIDGDGSFGIYGKKQILELNLTTSKFMAEETKKVLEELVPDIKINLYHAINCNENTYRLISTTQQYTYKLLKLLYEDSNFYIKRKYNNYLSIKELFNN